MEKLGVAVIGMGIMGSRHALVWRHLPYTRMVSVYDVVSERTDEYAAQFGCLGAGTLEEAIGAPGVDIVSICTDDRYHLEPCLAAAAAGKHILLEKPLATDPDEARRIVAAAESAGVKLMVGHIVRFDPRFAAAKVAVEEGQVGDIVHVYGRRTNTVSSGWRVGPRVSIAMFLGVHDIDIMQWVSGSRITRVYAEGCSKVLRDVGAHDNTVATLKFDNGAAGLLDLCWVMPAGAPNGLDARLDVAGTLGRVAVRNGGEESLLDTHERSTRADVTYLPNVMGVAYGALQVQLEHFARCVIEDSEPFVSNADALSAVDVAWAIDESLRTGALVEVRRD